MVLGVRSVTHSTNDSSEAGERIVEHLAKTEQMMAGRSRIGSEPDGTANFACVAEKAPGKFPEGC